MEVRIRRDLLVAALRQAEAQVAQLRAILAMPTETDEERCPKCGGTEFTEPADTLGDDPGERFCQGCGEQLPDEEDDDG